MKKYFILSNYKNYFLAKFFSFISPILKIWEKKYIKQFADMPLKHQPIFIIGAPRTGSTILYQTITNQFDVLYIDNLVSKFYRNLFFGFWLSNKIFKQKAHNCFKSEFGDTAQYGLRAPSECGEFWYRWLPKDRHFIDYEDFDDDMVKEIRSEISAAINFFDKPIVFKNLNAGQRLRLIKACFPNAKFIFIKREPIYTAQSILKARYKQNIQSDILWGIMPYNYNYIVAIKDIYKKIVMQIFYLEKQITKDKSLFVNENFLQLNYMQLENDLKINSLMLKKFIGVGERDIYSPSKISLTETLSLNKKEIDLFRQEINQLDWIDYNEK